MINVALTDEETEAWNTFKHPQDKNRKIDALRSLTTMLKLNPEEKRVNVLLDFWTAHLFPLKMFADTTQFPGESLKSAYALWEVQFKLSDSVISLFLAA